MDDLQAVTLKVEKGKPAIRKSFITVFQEQSKYLWICTKKALSKLIYIYMGSVANAAVLIICRSFVI